MFNKSIPLEKYNEFSYKTTNKLLHNTFIDIYFYLSQRFTLTKLFFDNKTAFYYQFEDIIDAIIDDTVSIDNVIDEDNLFDDFDEEYIEDQDKVKVAYNNFNKQYTTNNFPSFNYKTYFSNIDDKTINFLNYCFNYNAKLFYLLKEYFDYYDYSDNKLVMLDRYINERSFTHYYDNDIFFKQLNPKIKRFNTITYKADKEKPFYFNPFNKKYVEYKKRNANIFSKYKIKNKCYKNQKIEYGNHHLLRKDIDDETFYYNLFLNDIYEFEKKFKYVKEQIISTFYHPTRLYNLNDDELYDI
jgi:hypothetical protein